MARVFTWDGVILPMPKLKYGKMDISASDSGRTLSAKMDKKEIAKKVRLDCTWEMMTDTESSKILNTIKPNVYGSCSYPDPMVGSNTTKTFYSGDVDADLVFIEGDVCYWTINGVSLIEQ